MFPVALWLLPAAAAFAGDFAFPDFSGARGLSLVRAAKISGKVLRLTPAQPRKAGAAWFPVKQRVAGGFETTFTFRLTHQDPLRYRGADGLAFVIQDSGPSAIGGRGSAGGFATTDGDWSPVEPGIPRSIAIFFDTFWNPEDPSGNYVVLCGIGNVPDLRYPPRRLALRRALSVDLKDRNAHTVRIVYDPPRISVFLDRSADPVLALPVNMSGAVAADGTAYVGMTAATGSGYQNHDILSWSYRDRHVDVSSDISVVSSSIAFLKSACLPERTLCTPDQPIVEQTGPGRYHVVLPANAEWGASIPNPAPGIVRIRNATGTVCWQQVDRGSQGCNGPSGNGQMPQPGQGFIAPLQGAGALVMRTAKGRTAFSVNDRAAGFHDNEGFFEFDVELAVQETPSPL